VDRVTQANPIQHDFIIHEQSQSRPNAPLIVKDILTGVRKISEIGVK
jgi:hypothetical protein